MKIAWYSPLSPERSGIADYGALLLPALRRRLDIEVVRRGGRASSGADVAVYHVGNDPGAHDWIVQALRRRPGVVVLHDFVLHHLVAGMTLARGDAAGYLDAMEREAGLPGRLYAHGVVEGRLPPPWEARPEDFPLAGEALAHATGVVVHSRFVERLVRDTGFGGRLWRIPHPAWTPPDGDTPDFGPGPVIGCYGHLNPTKRIPALLAAFAELRGRCPDARLLLVGPAPPGLGPEREIARLGLERSPAVVREQYVDEARLWALMRAADVCVNLRWPTMGETSGTAVRALALGKPLVVSDVGWFSELPDDVALGIAPDEHEVSTLAAALELLVSDGEVRDALAAGARRYARAELDVERVAERYAAALEVAAGGDAVADAVLGEVAQAAAESGIGADSPELAEIAARLRELRIVS